MNDKLAKFAGRSITPKNAGHHGSVASDALVLVSKTDEKKGRHIVRVSLHARAVKQLAWQDGDRVRMDITENGAIVLGRDNTKGKTLGKATGSSARRYVRFHVIPELYEVMPVGPGHDVEIRDGLIAFEM